MMSTISSFYILVGAALVSLMPSVVAQLKGGQTRSWSFMLSFVGLVGLFPLWLFIFQSGWRVDLAATLFGTLFVGWMLTLVLTQISSVLRVLTFFLQAYWLVYFAVILPLLLLQGSGEIFDGDISFALVVHIGLALVTYVLLTQSAVVGVIMSLKEYGVRTGRFIDWWNRIPAIVEGELLQRRLMTASFSLLLIDILIGVSISYVQFGRFLSFDHKEVLSIATLAAIASLLVIQQKTGLRGRRALRWVAFIFLVATLGFPGVKLIEQLV